MKNKIYLALILFVCFAAVRAYAEEIQSKQIKITIAGVKIYHEYKELLDGIKKIDGVIDLVPSKIKEGEITLSGNLASDPAVFVNDVKALAMDRFDFNKKENDKLLEIGLKKL
ncbi:MAG: hypothetical protein HYY43_02385 [Deltaproteobacteria bacterium]|nr:hypothetical protein [Deltaproteobacteria bacterium]MBI2341733.1 hypothetical protein [Deltaproteobacteria bacterium]MBI2974423.1 hypothetical protein [Deltaproteobacteria bacterium]